MGMIDRSKVMKGLECHTKCCCEECPYYTVDDCYLEVCQHALALLREQDARIRSLVEEASEEYQRRERD